jgi:hypothetical protein
MKQIPEKEDLEHYWTYNLPEDKTPREEALFQLIMLSFNEAKIEEAIELIKRINYDNSLRNYE